ncbi:nicotinamidase-related amidase [Tamaricihabitans halophyticus]|uniref:Nicotinamidase-related amidase n=1 Tax=Tamaricihabitans halophyticus TaxID=1262583 RepID=A0A4R2R514_9PSEU|nr:cysteine hydrolase [Tamaricihabitans halophyticus]TCP56818.1 nicotinamidase-related amidase [Tamaricihabitans halophyticus]
MSINSPRAAVLALHWQINVIKPDGFFGGMLAEPVARSGVVARATDFHESAAAAGASVFFTRFTVPEGEGELVRNTAFMQAVADAQLSFRPAAPGTALIPEMAAGATTVDNQKLSGLAGNDLAARLTEQGIDTLYLTGVATNLTVEQTARHGTDLGFTVHVVTDCVTAASDDFHLAALNSLDLTTAGNRTAEEALAAIRASSPAA